MFIYVKQSWGSALGIGDYWWGNKYPCFSVIATLKNEESIKYTKNYQNNYVNKYHHSTPDARHFLT